MTQNSAGFPLFFWLLATVLGCDSNRIVSPTSNERWEVHQLKNVNIGYGVSRWTPAHDPPGMTTYSYEIHIKARRFGDDFEHVTSISSTESQTGQVMRCDWSATSGAGVMVSRATAHEDWLEIVTESAGKTATRKIPWNRETRGYFAINQSLGDNPMQPGESRSLNGLVPMLDQVAKIDLRAKSFEETELIDKHVRALHIDAVVKLPDGNQIESIIWTDQAGSILKEQMPNLGQTVFLATRAQALAAGQSSSADLGLSSVLPVRGMPADPHGTSQMVYRVLGSNENSIDVFPNSLSQQVHKETPLVAKIIVRAVRPESPVPADTGADPPRQEHTAPTQFIQSDDARIRSLAGQVALDERDPWKIATALESQVHRWIDAKDFSQALATAAEVAESKQGDCTEHAVLLAALCRSRQIPARVVVGLVCVPAQRAMCFHMWNEVWIGERWVPLDATLGRGGIGGGHIRIAESAMQSSDSLSVFLPVTQVMGQVEIEIVAAE